MARKLVQFLMVWVGISLVTFFLLRLTGNPARIVLGEFASDTAIAKFNQENGLDQPLATQYISYITTF